MDGLFFFRQYKVDGWGMVCLFYLLFLYPVCVRMEYALVGLTAEYVGIVLLSVGVAVSLWRGGGWRFHVADALFVAFVCWYAGRMSVGGEVMDGWVLVRGVGCLLLYFYFRRGSPAAFFFGMLFGAGVAQALWGILQCVGVLPRGQLWFAGSGGFHNPALWGIFSVVALLAGCGLRRHCRGRVAGCAWGAGMLLLAGAVCLSASRASWVALAAGGVWLAAASGKGRVLAGRFRSRWGGGWLLGVGLLAAVCAGGVAYGLYALRPASVDGRFLIWQVIAGAVGDAPWWGHGSLAAAYMPLQAAWFARHPEAVCAVVADNNQYAFNEFLRVVFECGAVGLLLFAGTLAAAFRAAWRGGAAARRAGGLLVAVVCFGMFGYPLSEAMVVVVVVVALAVVAGGGGGRCLWAGRIAAPVRWGMVAGVVCFLCFCTGLYVSGKRADGWLRRAVEEPSVLSGGEAAHYCRQWRGNADFMLCYGKMLYNHGRYGEALPVLEQAARLKPMSRLMCDLGDCLRAGGEFVRAEEVYGEASRMTPAHILPQYRLFCLYRDTGREAEAAERARYMLAMRVKVVNTSVLRYRHEARQFLDNQLQNR